ncbi:hypothetical protein ASC77_19585 [Nocardioides sp. Root1257]|uniref:MFS transporter n=1 Tax=unclassified Nocardioides TaxID=2615069 RepID=UPI000713C11F|nr:MULTISPECIES: MFS transporter [unclassified Nocardioides]KQW44990.1 hypothetical protein ASC77_19585 [Nocardioides sp. Root1257]
MTDAPDLEVTRSRTQAALLLVAFFMLGMSLRGALGGISVLLPMIGDDLDLSPTQQGALTSVALVSMAAAAPWGARVGRRLGPDAALGWVLAILALAEAARFLTTTLAGLLATVVAVGVAMGIGSTLIPAAVRRRVVRDRYGLTTGLHGAGMAIGVASAAAVALPIADATGNWRPALGVWSVATALTGVVWWLVLRTTRPVAVGSELTSSDVLVGSPVRLYRSAAAWLVTGYSAVVMVIGFTVLAWMPTMFVAEGLSLGAATTNLVLFQVIQLGSMTVFPIIIDRVATVRARLCVLLVPLGAAVIALALLIVAPVSTGAPAATLLGFGAGGGTALGMTLIARFASSDVHAAGLGSMVFAVSFTASALSPVLVGLSAQLTGSFAYGLGALALLALAVFVMVSVAFTRVEPRYP